MDPRLYFNEGLLGSKEDHAGSSTAGGETSVDLLGLRIQEPLGIAPDGSSLLVFDGEATVKPLGWFPFRQASRGVPRD